MLAGDADETLRALLPRLRARDRSQWRTGVMHQIRESRAKGDDQVAAPAKPINPQRVVRAMSDVLPDNAIVTADSGSSAVWLARYFDVRQGMQMSVSGGLATMGCGIPYATAGSSFTLIVLQSQ